MHIINKPFLKIRGTCAVFVLGFGMHIANIFQRIFESTLDPKKIKKDITITSNLDVDLPVGYLVSYRVA